MLRILTIPLATTLVATSLMATSLVGCSSTEADTVGELGWNFNYRDWSKANCADGATAGCTDDDVRACDNEPTDLLGAPGYPDVSVVNVSISDPDRGQIVFERDMDCALGESGSFMTLQGIARKVMALTLIGISADGAFIYAHPEVFDLDLSTDAEHTYDLRTPVGDINLDAIYPGVGVGLCPDDESVDTLRYEVTRSGETTVLTEGELDACGERDFFSQTVPANRVYIRNIPTAPTEGVGGGFVLEQFVVKLESFDSSGNLLHCGTLPRPVSPGRNTNNDPVTLSDGNCP